MPRSVRSLPPRPKVPLRVGDVVAETPFGTRVPVTLFPTIGINRPGTDPWPMLMRELEEISHWVRTQAVPRLVEELERMSRLKPTHTYNPDIVLSNFEVLEGMRDEAVALGTDEGVGD